ncbi:MAG: prolyl oligopeptidase family serine peptidase [Elusimicrobiota bacterium]|nr:prolyl oligopeptidase family serine peptidase [Elusimicrobiota bacterium]
MFEFVKFLSTITGIIPVETFKFYHTREKKRLKGMLWKPKGEGPFPLVAFDVGLQFRIWEIPLAAKIIARCGYAVIGTEYSRIEIAKGELKDITNAIEYAHKNFDFLNSKTILVGISMGAAAMLNIAAQVGEKYNVIAVVAISPYSDLIRAYYYAYGYTKSLDRTDPRARLLNLYQRYAYTNPFVEPKEYLVRSPLNFVHKIKCPVIFIHGRKDEIVTVDHSIELYYKMHYLKKYVDIKIVPGEGIHTPLTFSSMLKNLNFIGFVKTWFIVYEFLKKLKK